MTVRVRSAEVTSMNRGKYKPTTTYTIGIYARSLAVAVAEGPVFSLFV